MNQVQNPVDYIRARRAASLSAKRMMKGCLPGTCFRTQCAEIRRFHTLSAWSTRQYYRSANTTVPRLALVV